MDNIYDTLLNLPLFQGVSKVRLEELVEKTKFHFLKYNPGTVIVKRGEECTDLKFILKGEVRSELINRSAKIKILETLQYPNVLAPNHLFGRNTYYPSEMTAIDEVSVMQISKSSFIQILQNDTIFLINLLNILSRRSQKHLEAFLMLTNRDVREKLAFWILSFTQRKSKDIVLQCKQKDLYTYFGVQRSVFIHTLEEMAAEGILTFDTKEITIKDRSLLREQLIGDDMPEPLLSEE